MSAIMSTAMRRPSPSAGTPSVAMMGTDVMIEPYGMPGTAKLSSTACTATNGSWEGDTGTP